MKKIFSAALALVCVWFATPTFANCNLFDISQSPTTENISSNLIWTRYNINVSSTSLSVGDWTAKHTDFISPGTYTITFNGIDSVAVRGYDGSNLSVLRRGNGSFTITNPTQIWIFVASPEVMARITEIMLEQGSTATSYVPYNPQCATCDGTVVNYVSATGTGVQNGTPTPTNPIYPTFYQQGNMVLRKVGNIADSYDATTGKITRRVGEYIFTGRESIDRQYNVYGVTTIPYDMNKVTNASLCSHNKTYTNSLGTNNRTFDTFLFFTNVNWVGFGVNDTPPEITDTETFKQWLAAQYAAGTPVTVWYPLETETTEDWPASQCTTDPIKIATTKYNETKFSPLNTALANAISVVDTVVTQTITQAGRIATLQAQKQTRPNDIADDNEKCPAGKKCLLVEDASGVPHWYEIVEPLLPAGYIQLQWIESTGTQFIDTGIKANASIVVDMGVLFSRIGSVSAALGTRNGTNTSDTNVFQFGVNSNNTFFHRYGVSAPDGTGVPVAQTLYDVHLENYKEIISNGQDTYTNTLEFNPNMDTEGTLYIFATHDISSGRPIFSMSGYITYLSISVDGVLVRDFVPALNPDGKIGMYDLVGGRFYENAGTGEFIAGDPVSE